MNTQERHFVNQWKEQKSGPRWQYYALFTGAWTVVAFLVIFFLTKLFTNLWENGGANLIYAILGVSLIVGFFSTHYNYVSSERRYKKIMDKEQEKLN